MTTRPGRSPGCRPTSTDPLWGQWAPALWRPWYAAVLAEAVVLAGAPESDVRLRAAAEAARDNPVTATLVRRAAALDAGDHQSVAATAAELDALGSAYQADRSRRLAARTISGAG